MANAGSSNLKLRVVGDAGELLADAELPPEPTRGELTRFLHGAPRCDAAGHRFVHGGPDLRASTPVDETVLERLRAVSDLAPLHNPRALSALELLRELRPGLPHVACFDTAFHATLPPEAFVYAVPPEWGVRRFGFHGLSHAHAARRAAQLLGRDDLRLVTCHLGAGASLAAVRDGRSLDTTMGFTPAEGLVMATRSGSVDPGIVTWVQRHAGLSAEEVEHALERESGLLALAGSSDMREVVERAGRGEERATLALGVYLHRLRAGIAAMASAIGGLDAIIFTGGVGERSAAVRAGACDGLRWLGAELDARRNEQLDGEDADVATGGSGVRVLVARAREDLEIAAEVRRLAG